MGLPGYDAWLTYDSAGERAGALHEHLSADPGLSELQDRVERRAARVDALAMALRASRGERGERIETLMRWARSRAKAARRALEDAIDVAGEYDGPDRMEDV